MTGITARHRNEHHHGQQLHAAGRGIESCNHPNAVTQAWRRAGWHDADMESGKFKYFGPKGANDGRNS